ncbi:flagellar hook-length control protein FliK [Massilia sp. MB5]|uniref:flagellar hook-length control protein FliK n=1 Tax=Massilia sp. MB5 TaxID=2919578 RepID=UPI001F118EAC|nr:flagellar hook-length control protein FliK [Massilia sp. MB5]UMR30741.1 flagellar hook-length control protein FliK [Massilia sp. MB5]
MRAQNTQGEVMTVQRESAPAPQAMPAMAPAGQATLQAANAVASNQLQARVGSQAWDQQLGQKVVWMAAGGEQSASLTLNPPDLGPLQVVLSISNDQASASFTAAQPEVRQALENALPKLRDMMNEAGIQLGNATVSAGSQEQQEAFARQTGGNRGQGGRGAGAGTGTAGDDGAPAASAPQRVRSGLGVVDTFA